MCELKQDLRYLNDTLKDRLLGNLTEEVERLVDRSKEIYEVNFEVQWSGDSTCVPPVIVAELKLILTEAIINAIRHGEAKQIELHFTISYRNIIVTVSDNGQGFDLGRIKPGGLENMRKRTERLGGAFNVESVPEEGTTVVANIPYEPTERKGEEENEQQGSENATKGRYSGGRKV